jgi:hypothetical protein
MIADLVKQKKIRVESVTKQPDQPGMMKSLLMMGITWAARTGISYLTQQMAAAAQNKSHAHADHPPDHEPGPSPLHEPWSSTSRDA